MTRDEVDAAMAELREVESKMTQAPWEGDGLPWNIVTATDEPIAQVEAVNPLWTYDKDGIITMRNKAMPLIGALAAEVERLREAVAKLTEKLQ